jgi:PAS domain S-box-containing protein
MSSTSPPGEAPAVRLLRDLLRELPAELSAHWSLPLYRLGALLRGEANGHPPADPFPPPPGDSEAWDSRLRYQELFDFCPDGLLTTDFAGIVREANHAAAALLRTRKEFLIGKPLPLFVCEGSRSAFYAGLLRARQGQNAFEGWHVPLRSVTGERVEVLLWAAAVKESDRPFGVRWLLRDVTSLLRAERSLRAERDFAESLLENAQALVAVVDDRGVVLHTNLCLRQVFGCQEGELAGRTWSGLVPEENAAAAAEMLKQALRLGAARHCSAGLRTRAGARREVNWSAKAFLRADQGTSVVIVGHDVTDLLEAQRKALQAERLAALGQVMANLAHEGRSLLQRSAACLERLGWRLEDRPEALEILARAQQAQRELVQLFEDVRSHAAPLNLRPSACDLRELWREAWEEARLAFTAQDGELVEEGASGALACRVDRFRLLQVFRNVMENSFAACPGRLRLEVVCREADLAGRPAVELSFRDNGAGLDPEQRERIFEAFYTTRPHGSGLGMAISKRIVDAHGGRIAVGGAGPGAEIIVTLPRE